MAFATVSAASGLAGVRLPARPATASIRRAGRRALVCNAGVDRKVNSFDEKWSRGWTGTGIFVEGNEKANVNILSNMEKKKLLSSVEESGLLASMDKAGLSLSKIEELGLLSTAEKLGALSLLEKAATTEPGAIAALSIPCLVAAILAATLLPGDNTLELVLKTVVTGGLTAGFATFLAGGFLVAALQEE